MFPNPETSTLALPLAPPQGEPDSLRAPGDEPLVVPEDVGRAAAQLLLDEVARGGVVDGAHQGLLLLLAALGPEEVSQVRPGARCIPLGGACHGATMIRGLVLTVSVLVCACVSMSVFVRACMCASMCLYSVFLRCSYA